VVWSFDIAADGKSMRNQKQFSDFMVDGIRCATDGIRVDIYGNLWCGSNAGANVGYSGVTVWNPEGKLLGRIRCRRRAPTSASADRSGTGCS
jgi:gluconolactonase